MYTIYAPLILFLVSATTLNVQILAQTDAPAENALTPHLTSVQLTNNAVEDQKLYVLTSMFVPGNSRVREELYQEFVKHMQEFPEVELWTIECAIGNNSFYFTDASNPHHVQVRAQHYVFFKQNLLNVLFSKLPSTAKYVAWIDADVYICRKTWAKDTIELLGKVDIVQLHSLALMVDKNGGIEMTLQSFMNYAVNNYRMLANVPKGQRVHGHNGLGWAATAQYIRRVGFYDLSLTGAGDLMIGSAALGRWQGGFDIPALEAPAFYKKTEEWGNNAAAKKGYGYIPGTVVHLFHGSTPQRNYGFRSRVILKNQFDPYNDMYYNQDGVLQIKPQKHQLIEDLRELSVLLATNAQPTGAPDLQKICQSYGSGGSLQQTYVQLNTP